ncbi:DUF397 domain-containing protein [Sphaerimonospora mesophila]|uniref:DUF397 domain-containing protein n=2 Tax=Sphaerimonospora TaxID=1792303 RepID=UPI000AE4BF99
MESNAMNDLYDRDLAGARFRRLCGGNQQEEEMESCVEVAPIPGAADAYALRDSKNPTAGTLRFTGAELRAAGIATAAL